MRLRSFRRNWPNNQSHFQAMIYLGDAQMRLNHPEVAIPLFEKALQIDPRLELAHLDMGILDEDAGRNDDALRELKAAERLMPSDVMFTGTWGVFTGPWETRKRRRLNWTRPRTLPRPPIPL